MKVLLRFFLGCFFLCFLLVAELRMAPLVFPLHFLVALQSRAISASSSISRKGRNDEIRYIRASYESFGIRDRFVARADIASIIESARI